MSSIVIAGDTSGSVTLQAPATAGTTILTLPTTSGTLALTTAASQWTTTGSDIYYSTGNVGLKTTTFSSISGTVATLSVGGTNASTTGGIAYQANGTVKGYHYIDSDNMTHQSISGGHLFLAVNTEKARINTYGLGLGGAIPSSGTGIAFPATQSASSNANTLDDYEEGTWTPGFRDWVFDVNSSFTYTSRSGTYTKIGRVVTCYFTATIATVTAGNGQAFGLDGLPFDPNSSLPFIGTLATSGVDWPANTLTTAITYFSTTNAAIFTATGDNVSTIRLTSGGTAAGDVIEGSLVYYVA